MVSVNVGDRFTHHTAVIEKSPIYKVAYDLMTQTMQFSAHISKNAANPVGIRIKELSDHSQLQLCQDLRFHCRARNA